MKALSFLKLASAAAFMLVGVSVAAPAQAATGTWNGFATGPTMYQTNWGYHSSVMTPPGSVPSTADVYYLSWSASFSRYPSGLAVHLCSTNSPCYYMGGASGGGYVASGTYNASDQFQFGFIDNQPTTYTYSSKFLSNPVGGGHQLFVAYQY